jgi:hypothetical protein
MKNLEEEQRKMRERMVAAKPRRAKAEQSVPAKTEEVKDVKMLLKRIELLESENIRLKSEIAELRDQPRTQSRSHESDERERRHLFMKYSNVRRY